MHIALRAMKVQGADGVVRDVKPGGKVPEAKDWKSVKAYEKQGRLARVDAVPTDRTAGKIIDAAMVDRNKTIRRLAAELKEVNAESERIAAAASVAITERDDLIQRLAKELGAEKLKNSVAPESDATDATDATDAEPDGKSHDPGQHAEGCAETGLPWECDCTPEPVSAEPEPTNKDGAPKLSGKELEAMAKGSLQALADDLSINPDQSKPKLVKAILKAQ